MRFFDVASIPEIDLIARRCPDARMAFLHPVKSRQAIRQAYFKYGVRTFALDCEAELEKILEVTGHADDLTLIVRLAVSNDGAAFSLAGKFGAPAFEAADLILATRAHANELGVSFHVGSQCMQPSAFRNSMLEASRLIAQAGVTVDIVDVGGGFPSIYPGLTPPPLEDYLQAIDDAFEDMMVLQNAELWCEPGRALVAEASSILTRVELRKGDALYLNDGSYGTLFDATHAKWPFPMRVLPCRNGRACPARCQPFRLFGPTCDSTRFHAGTVSICRPTSAKAIVIEIGMLGAYGDRAWPRRFNGFRPE